MSSATEQRVRTVRDLYQVMCIEATPAEWMRRYLFDQPPTMTAQEAWEQCPDEVAMVYVAGLLGVPSEVLVGIAIECARVVVEHGLPEAAEFIQFADELRTCDGWLQDWPTRLGDIEQAVRDRDGSEIVNRAKVATLAAHSASLTAVMQWCGRMDGVLDRACEAVCYASTATDGHPEPVQAIVRERLAWPVMEAQLEGLWPEEAATDA